MKRRIYCLIAFFALFFSSCTSAEEITQSSIEEKTVAVASQSTTAPSPTPSPIPSLTKEPTLVPTGIPTMAWISVPSPTPDPRVINTKPRLMILTEEEIDVYFDYGMYGSFPSYEEYGSSRTPYANLTCTLGYENAADFIESTGLVTGWTTQYIRAKINPYIDTGLPNHFEFFVMLFQTVEGSKAFMEEWDSPCEFDFYEYVTDLPFGEKATLCRYESWMQNGVLSHIRYRIAVRYKNVYLGVRVFEDPDKKLDMENIYFVTNLQLNKIAGLPLEDSVTLAQDFVPGAGCAVPPTPEESNVPADIVNANNLGWCLYDPVTYACTSKCMEQRPLLTSADDEPLDYIPCILSTKIDIIDIGEAPE